MKIYYIKKLLLFNLLLITLFLLSCQGEVTPEVIITNSPTVFKTHTSPTILSPTRTVTIKPSQTISNTSTFTPSQTQVPCPDFSGAKIFSMGPMEYWNFFFTIQIEDEILGDYYAILDKNKQYKCFKLEEYPNRIYCHGPQVAINDFVDYELYKIGIDKPVLKGSFFIPLYFPPSK